MPRTTLELRSTIAASGVLTLALEEIAVADPAPGEVIVRIEAAPINPSDLGLLVGPADIATLEASGTPERPVLRLIVPQARRAAVRARLDQSLPIGNEGAGTVIAAGEGAEALIGTRVAVIGGGMYTQLRRLPAAGCVVLPQDVTVTDGAALFVNPLTALAFTDAMRREGHKAIVHTAAASNLGQMLNRLCLADGIPLVNIVRSQAQAALLRGQGAVHVLDSSTAGFAARLADSIAATGATLAFDAIGGGDLAGMILEAMETAVNRQAEAYSRYGSSVFKQVYIYGALDTRPTSLARNFGFAWGVGSWLLTPYLQKIGAQASAALRQRVLADIKTIFASRFTDRIGLAQALHPDTFLAYERKLTGQKYLIDPTLG